MIKNNTNKKGFTLAEMMMSMLIVSIILAAIMPTIIKNVKVERDHIWRWADSNSIYFSRHDRNFSGKILKETSKSNSENFLRDYEMKLKGRNAIYAGLPAAPVYEGDSGTTIKVKRHKFGKDDGSLDSQLGIYTHNLTGHPLAASHIDLYEKEDDSIKYVGRIAADDYNIAFGIGTLQKLKVTYGDPSLLPKYNTGIGQFSLYNNATGKGNTAIGYSALRNNISGQYNTAVGSLAGKNYRYGEDNTLIGYSAGTYPDNNQSITDGNRNTIIGAYACGKKKPSGDDSDNGFSADRNICIGYNAAGKYEFDERNSKDRIFIGSDDNDQVSGSHYIPLISGHTNYNVDSSSGMIDYDKDIEFNLKKFNINTFEGQQTMHSYTVGVDDRTYTGEITSKYYLLDEDNYTGYKVYSESKLNADSEAKVIAADIHTASDSGEAKVNINNGGLKINMNVGDDKETGSEVSFSSAGTFSLIANKDCDPITGCKGFGKMTLSDKGLELEINNDKSDEFLIDVGSSKGFCLNADKGNLSLDAKENIELYTNGFVEFRSEKKFELSPKVVVYGEHPVIINDPESVITIGNGEGQVVIDGSNFAITAKDVLTDFSGINYINGTTVSGAVNVLWRKIDEVKTRASSTPSDIRLKNVSGDNNAGLEEINKLQVKDFTYKNDKKKEPHVGVIAQDLQKIFPNSVFKDNDGYLKIKTEEVFYALINSIKQLFVKIQDLTNKISEIDKNLSNMENETEMIKIKNDTIEKRLRKLEQKQEIRSGKHE